MKTEAKVAWPKKHPFNDKLIQTLRDGQEIDHAEMLAAVDDPDSMKVFGPGTFSPIYKNDYVIFQYGVIIQRSDGRVAIFHRPTYEAGRVRTTTGPTMIVSASYAAPPHRAVPLLVHQQLCVDRANERIDRIEPMGVAWNPVLPNPEEGARATYLMALYRIIFPEALTLYGRVRSSPDRFIEWVPSQKLGESMEAAGSIDQMLARQFAASAPQLESDHYAGPIYSQHARLVDASQPTSDFEPLSYRNGYHVFVSHAAEDAFSALALFRMLLEESRHEIFPTVDVVDIKDGHQLTQAIHRLVEECDCLILMITPTLIAKDDQGKCDWVRMEVELAQKLGKPILAFKMGTTKTPSFVDSDLISNPNDHYCDWIHEVRQLIESVKEQLTFRMR